MKDKIKQCKSCPWRVDCVPDRDIPNYDKKLAEKLACTIRSGIESMTGPRHIMACHYSEPSKEIHCAGWMHNQLGASNNLGLRLDVMTGRAPVPVIDGEQHKHFEDTLPKPKRRMK